MDVIKGGTLSGTTTVATTVSSIERDRVVHDFPSHSAKEPRVLIFQRQLPAAGGSGSLKAVIKTVFGDLNEDGTSRSGNVIVETKITIPQDQTSVLAEDALEHHYAVLRDASVTDPLVEKGQIPYA